MSKSIRVSDETHAALRALKTDEETFDELLSRLVRERKELVRDGAGLWSGSDAAEQARSARKTFKQQLEQ